MNRKSGNLFWGGIFLLAAGFILFNKLGYFGQVNIVTSILSVGLGAIILQSIPRFHFAGLLIPAALLCILYDKQWGIENLTPWPVLATAVLGSIGLSLIFKKRNRYQYQYIKDIKKKYEESEIIDKEDGGYIEYRNNFGSSIKYINSDDLKKVVLECKFGAMKVYFDNAMIQGESASLEIYSSFSGVELYIPSDWKIEQNAKCSFGGIDEHEKHRRGDYDKVLKMTGNINFSGVEIHYF